MSPRVPQRRVEERERIALEARQHLRSRGVKRYGTFLKELKARGLSVTTSEAAELYHRVEPGVRQRPRTGRFSLWWSGATFLACRTECVFRRQNRSWRPSGVFARNFTTLCRSTPAAARPDGR